MNTSILSSKGQIIIPKQVREAHHWRTGTEFVIGSFGDGIYLKPRKPFPPTRVEDGLGCAGYSGPAKTEAEMEAGIVADIRRKWLSGEE